MIARQTQHEHTLLPRISFEAESAPADEAIECDVILSTGTSGRLASSLLLTSPAVQRPRVRRERLHECPPELSRVGGKRRRCSSTSIDSPAAQSFKCFLCPSGIDEFPPAAEKDLLLAMPELREAGVPLLVHAELELPLQEAASQDPRDYATYLHSRPKEWEDAAVAMMVDLCRRDDLVLDLSTTHYVAHWVTPLGERRRFDTRFFLTEAPPDQEGVHWRHPIELNGSWSFATRYMPS